MVPMGVPQVAIVGRPNVGKSSILNWLAKKRLAIVDDKPGVTRDRIKYLMSEEDQFFELVDTGGIGIVDSDDLTEDVDRQIQMALDEASVILFVVDTRVGITPLDEQVAQRLRSIDKPILLVANKTDDAHFDSQADEFYRLGIGAPIKVSAMQNRNRGQLIEQIVRDVPRHGDSADTEPPVMRVAIVGRRNVGKSTFVNTLARAERMIVSEIAGTTRDSVDVRFELDGKSFIAIDTPGLRRSKSVRTDLDFYSTHRAQRSIRRADVVLMFFDPMEPISRVDKQLCQYIADHYRPCIFVVNKWDLLAKSMPTDRWVRYLRETFQTMWHVPIAFITGQTGKNVKALLNHAQNMFKQSLMRIPTSQLNRLVRKAIERHPPPLSRGRTGRIYYATQVGTQPPTIVLVCNDPRAFSAQYRRYLLGVFRDQLDFGEVPIKLYLHRRSETEARAKGDSVGKVDMADELAGVGTGDDQELDGFHDEQLESDGEFDESSDELGEEDELVSEGFDDDDLSAFGGETDDEEFAAAGEFPTGEFPTDAAGDDAPPKSRDAENQDETA